MTDVDVLGIDLGTTNSSIGIWRPQHNEVEILPSSEGTALTPSVVTWAGDTALAIVGTPALAIRELTPEAAFYSVKRFIGKSASDAEVVADGRRMTYDVRELADGSVSVSTPERSLSPEEVSAEILRKLRNDAEHALGREVRRAVLTVPAYFQEPQREATRQSAILAGIEVAQLVNEPTAAALGFGLGEDDQTIAVYDLGGGTFDISLLRIEHGLFRVRATRGHTHLGGDDFDAVIVDWLSARYRDENGTRPALEDVHVRARLTAVATATKVALSDTREHVIELADVRGNDGRSHDLVVSMGRAQLNSLIAPLIDQTISISRDMLSVAGIESDAVNQVLLVGGQTRTPAVAAALERRFGWKVNTSVNPEEAVARGAAVLGARLCGLLTDRLTLWDLTPFALGVELSGGAFDPIIGANTRVPVKRWRRGAAAFTTHQDAQPRIRLRVFQGNARIANENVLIGEVVLDLPTARPRGVPRINCLFSLDRDGILHVRAEDDDTGAAVEHTFERSYQAAAAELYLGESGIPEGEGRA